MNLEQRVHQAGEVLGHLDGFAERNQTRSRVLAGDFNATLDHSMLRAGMVGCDDAAAQRGDGLIPTWGPTQRTRAIGPQIDHVLATRGIQAASFQVLDLPGSDHHAILATLRLP